MKIKHYRLGVCIGCNNPWSCKETRDLKETFRTIKVGRKSLKSLVGATKYSTIKSDFHLIKKYAFAKNCEVALKKLVQENPENLEIQENSTSHHLVLIQHLRNWILDPRDQENLQKKEV